MAEVCSSQPRPSRQLSFPLRESLHNLTRSPANSFPAQVYLDPSRRSAKVVATASSSVRFRNLDTLLRQYQFQPSMSKISFLASFGIRRKLNDDRGRKELFTTYITAYNNRNMYYPNACPQALRNVQPRLHPSAAERRPFLLTCRGYCRWADLVEGSVICKSTTTPPINLDGTEAKTMSRWPLRPR